MVYNKIYAQIGEERHITLDPVNYQYDVKQILVISGETVPDYYEADVCNAGDTATLTMVGTAADGVEIPDKFLQDGRNVLVYVVIPGNGGDVQTRYDITIPVDERAEREDIDPSEAEQQQIDSLINALNSGVARAEAAATAAAESATDAEGSAGESEDQAENAEAWAVGQRAGTDVDVDDQTYHNNSKYYAGMAEAAAEEAGRHEASWESWVRRAENAADDAEGSARAAAGSKADAETAAQTATQKATEAGNSAAAAAGSAAEARQTVAGGVGAINTARDGALTAIGRAGTTQTGAVNQAGADQVTAVNQAGATQVQAVEDKGDEVRDSIPQDYSDLVDDVADLTRQLSDVETATYTEIQNDIDWLIGTISGHGYPKTNSKRLVTGNFLNLGDVSVEDGGEIAIHAYSSTTAYLGGWANWAKSIKKSEILTTYPTAKYMRVVFMRTNNTDCSLSDIQTYGIRIYDEFASVETKNNNTKKSIIVPMPAELGGIKNTGLPQTDPESANYVRLRTSGFIKLDKNCVYKATVNKGIKVSVSLYPSAGLSTNRTAYTQWGLNYQIFISTENYARFTFAKEDVTQYITPSELTEFKLEKISDFGSDYMIDTGFNMIPVTAFPIGTLSGLQSFCKYNDKYYSTNGSNLYVQEEDFTLESTTELSLGHGNSLQLGHDGKAYVSGWNDDSVYVVDLSTKTIDDTIPLPVTGYTTVAVDDINKLMYIFHRTSYPSTEEYYNFVVYDYDNEQTISTKKITKAFGAMQSCDFVDGKIIVINGTGTAGLPNGYRIFNTNGDIIAEYVLNSYSTVEPEGVCFDRDAKELLISFNTSSTCTLCKILT